MRTVVATDEGILELNWTWLPTFIGMNSVLKEELEKELGTRVEGRILDDATLDFADRLVRDFLAKKFNGIKGMTDFLDGLKYVYYV